MLEREVELLGGDLVALPIGERLLVDGNHLVAHLLELAVPGLGVEPPVADDVVLVCAPAVGGAQILADLARGLGFAGEPAVAAAVGMGVRFRQIGETACGITISGTDRLHHRDS